MRRLVVLIGLAGLLAAGLFAIAAPSSAPAAKGDRACPENPHGGTERDPSCGKSGQETPCPENSRSNKPGCEEEEAAGPCASAELVVLTTLSSGAPAIVCLYGPDNADRTESECTNAILARSQEGVGGICIRNPS